MELILLVLIILNYLTNIGLGVWLTSLHMSIAKERAKKDTLLSIIQRQANGDTDCVGDFDGDGCTEHEPTQRRIGF